MSEAKEAVTRALRSYADRGVFRGFAVNPAARGRVEYRFSWLHETSFVLVLDPRSRSLTFRDLLPGVAYPSPMDRAFRAFLKERSDPALPNHRRIDPDRVRVKGANRGGTVSLSIEVLRSDWSYATKSAVSLVNEIFHGFLRGPYFQYMVDNFGEAEE